VSESQQMDAPEKKSGSKGLVIALVVIILALAGAMVAIVMGKVDLEKLLEEPPPPPIVMLEEPAFKPLDKFVVSVNNGYTRNYMVLDITVVSHHPHMPEKVDQLSSLLQNTLLKFFSGLNMEQIQQKLDNINQLQIDLRHAFMDSAEEYGRELPIEEVLLTNVVVQ